jgi:hypothetical protein
MEFSIFFQKKIKKNNGPHEIINKKLLMFEMLQNVNAFLFYLLPLH